LAEDTKASGRPRIILSLNDYDPSGSIMLEDILRRAKHYAPDAEFYSEQVALTREQVTKYKLPTRPTKIEGNTHARNFSDTESVELDAMDPTILTELLRTAIERHIDGQALKVMFEAEDSERAILENLAGYSGCQS
jgi:hypothetical protein